ncbi:MAG TPA: thioredoxin domain-containing protein, partial [Bacteroidia bacterium]|nr:thioredoxin domain-containing protein [Bacteroidia bacterium]
MSRIFYFMQHTNSLIHQKSPYLLQHAHNPVNWYAWGDEAFAKAKAENKLVLISIGYSSCHWCHVMEHECFEDEQTATLMNRSFVNVKVDREERPDVDHIYMTAVQLMSGHGGWPLNCFILPDGRPVYGGTYFPKQQWQNLLQKLAELYTHNKDQVEQYAKELTQGIKQTDELLHISPGEKTISKELLERSVQNWQKRFDKANGGNAGSPKFPMPNNYLFLLKYAHLNKDEEVMSHVHLTLQKMAQGGIYDHAGGGFARYSTDALWKVPHFEKMLYDNAQLISLYAETYRQTPNPLYKQVVYETVEFLQREMMSDEGGFYSALDADSEGVEGKFYVWAKEELREILKKDFDVFADHYSVNEQGYWEDGNYILLRDLPLAEVLLKHQLKEDELQKIITRSKEKLLAERKKRVPPGLDDKIITSWNALLCKALVDACQAFNEDRFLQLAQKNADFIIRYLLKKDHSLYRCCKKTEAYGHGFLDDYAFVIDAFASLFSVTGKEDYLTKSEALTQYCFDHFFSREKNLFYYTSHASNELISKSFEVSDNVIPASNSQMALNLHTLAAITGNTRYEETSAKMLGQMADELPYLASHSNWGLLALRHIFNFYEICVVGNHVDEFMRDFGKHCLANTIFVYSKQASQIALLAGRYVPHETYIYVCSNKACMQPVSSV